VVLPRGLPRAGAPHTGAAAALLQGNASGQVQVRSPGFRLAGVEMRCRWSQALRSLQRLSTRSRGCFCSGAACCPSFPACQHPHRDWPAAALTWQMPIGTRLLRSPVPFLSPALPGAFPIPQRTSCSSSWRLQWQCPRMSLCASASSVHSGPSPKRQAHRWPAASGLSRPHSALAFVHCTLLHFC
jgi:hypothetical protein